MAREGGEGSGEHMREEDSLEESCRGKIDVELSCGEEAGGEEEPEGTGAVGSESTVLKDFEATLGGMPTEEGVGGIRDGVFMERAGEEDG